MQMLAKSGFSRARGKSVLEVVMNTTVSTVARLFIADRASYCPGLVGALASARIVASDVFEKTGNWTDLRAPHTDVLLEVRGGPWVLSELFPDILQLPDWNAFASVPDLHGPSIVVITRAERQEPAQVQAADQELVALLKRRLGRSSTSSPFPTAVANETIADMPAPFPGGNAQALFMRLAAEVAHDLNNLAAIIKQTCRLLVHDLSLSQFGRKLTGEIDKTGDQAALLANHLVLASRGEDLPAQVEDIHAVLEGAVGLLRGLLGGNQLVLDLDPRPCPVLLVPGQLQRVLVNLAANAKNAMPDGGVFTVSTVLLDGDPPITLARATLVGPHIRITVSDTGTGMDEDARRRLFQRHAVPAASVHGIGLAIVANILRQHRGHIEIQSRPGAGTTAQIFLPRAPAPESSTNPISKPPASSETILFVEDDGAVRKVIRQILFAKGFAVLEAGGGAEALALAEQFPGPIHLLISDLSMPRMNGKELGERFARLHPETKVLFVSGHDRRTLPGDQAPREDAPFLQKPFNNEELLQKIRKVLHRAM
jgi:signal transduction histidine kinase